MSAPPAGVRAHYADFHDELALDPSQDDRPLLVVLGNCQGESLRLMLDADDVRTVRVPPVHELDADDVGPLHRLVARADLLVTQPVADDYRGLPLGTGQLLALARPALRHVLVPSVRFAGLHPAHVVVHPPHLVRPDPPVVAYHDVRTAVRAAWVRAGRAAPSDLGQAPFTAAQVLAVGAASVAELARRETAHGLLAVSDLLLRPTFASMRTVNHPGNAVLAPVAARLRAVLGLDERPPGVTRPLLDAVHAPREEAVVAVLDPTTTPRPWWVLDGREVPLADVESAHLRFYAERPDVLDAVIDRTAWLRDLLGLPLPRATGGAV